MRAGDGGKAELKNKIQNALDEGRMLVLGSQVLLGFQYRSAFESGFEKLPLSSQYLRASALCLMLLAIGFLLAPGAYHRIVERGEETKHFHRFASRMLGAAMIPRQEVVGRAGVRSKNTEVRMKEVAARF